MWRLMFLVAFGTDQGKVNTAGFVEVFLVLSCKADPDFEQVLYVLKTRRWNATFTFGDGNQTRSHFVSHKFALIIVAPYCDSI